MALQSKGGAKDIFSNITGILEETFPDVDITDIPGFKPGENTPETRTNFAVFMCSLIFGMFWITYITFFNSSVVGSICTKIINIQHFCQTPNVKMESLS